MSPVVKSTRDRVALELTLRQVTAHVAAVPVEHIDLAVPAAEDDQFLTECVDRVWFTVAELFDQAQAVPAAGEPARRRLCLDEPNFPPASDCVPTPTIERFSHRLCPQPFR